MSIWTHISGSVRIDGLFLDLESIEGFSNNLKERFGNTCQFNDDEVVWDACNVPCGSEGSVQYRIVPYNYSGAIMWGSVLIWGDLRNYSNVQDVHEWIRRACDGMLIRQCAVLVEIEFGERFLITTRETDDYKTEIIMVRVDK